MSFIKRTSRTRMSAGFILIFILLCGLGHTEMDEIPPNDPSNLVLTPVSPSQIHLSWTDNSNNETGFKIERYYLSISAWVQIGTVSENVVTYESTGLPTEAIIYEFRVRAYNSYGNSNYASNNGYTLPLQPVNLTVTDASTATVGKLLVAWDNVSAREQGFLLERSASGSDPWTTVATLSPTQVSYTDETGLSLGTRYWYRVRSLIYY